VEFVVDAVSDVSFSFVPLDSRQQSSPADVSSAATVPQLILLAVSDSQDRVLSVYIEHGNNDDGVTESRLIVERRILTSTDRLSVSLASTQAKSFACCCRDDFISFV